MKYAILFLSVAALCYGYPDGCRVLFPNSEYADGCKCIEYRGVETTYSYYKIHLKMCGDMDYMRKEEYRHNDSVTVIATEICEYLPEEDNVSCIEYTKKRLNRRSGKKQEMKESLLREIGKEDYKYLFGK